MRPPLSPDARVLRQKQLAYAAVIHNGAFTIGLAQENEPGYWPTPQHGTFLNYDQAAVKAHELNTARGLTPADAARIIGSSMFPQNRRPNRPNRP